MEFREATSVAQPKGKACFCIFPSSYALQFMINLFSSLKSACLTNLKVLGWQGPCWSCLLIMVNT